MLGNPASDTKDNCRRKTSWARIAIDLPISMAKVSCRCWRTTFKIRLFCGIAMESRLSQHKFAALGHNHGDNLRGSDSVPSTRGSDRAGSDLGSHAFEIGPGPSLGGSNSGRPVARRS